MREVLKVRNPISIWAMMLKHEDHLGLQIRVTESESL